jgi:hypothetical protein
MQSSFAKRQWELCTLVLHWLRLKAGDYPFTSQSVLGARLKPGTLQEETLPCLMVSPILPWCCITEVPNHWGTNANLCMTRDCLMWYWLVGWNTSILTYVHIIMIFEYKEASAYPFVVRLRPRSWGCGTLTWQDIRLASCHWMLPWRSIDNLENKPWFQWPTLGRTICWILRLLGSIDGYKNLSEKCDWNCTLLWLRLQKRANTRWEKHTPTIVAHESINNLTSKVMVKRRQHNLKSNTARSKFVPSKESHSFKLLWSLRHSHPKLLVIKWLILYPRSFVISLVSW